MTVLMDKLLTNEWTKMPYWWGNPDLGYECWGKKYPSGYSKVYIFGRKNKHKEEYQVSDYMYCVRESHSGMFRENSTPEQLMAYLDLRHKLRLMDSGRSLPETALKQIL